MFALLEARTICPCFKQSKQLSTVVHNSAKPKMKYYGREVTKRIAGAG